MQSLEYDFHPILIVILIEYWEQEIQDHFKTNICIFSFP